MCVFILWNCRAVSKLDMGERSSVRHHISNTVLVSVSFPLVKQTQMNVTNTGDVSKHTVKLRTRSFTKIFYL